ncbi:hypothetical protein Barba22A_gp007 [Rheinheimera phage vB_RspM_Barba22A]|jgi:hypothetical protein|uniref:Uncharacterized protein n=82 Tax=Barbavirus TaxID=2733095 RepID=A0A7G9VS33_9CAUD|nr:hypothetical protein HOV44_gp009 [Rheinheimera phage Barba5S]YP_009822745.1 hypothetical protein HOV45_gp009 [Rheinheimera phage Barba8S]YP_009822884.1 hypothetical protein HOV46_gp007 [Rheinheimera phage vB_RspM_Barba18A]YP_009823163.1 hypothetical protein HOV48_gp007 [Rheinheimera phage Barba21A]QCQ57858.1 hypothetical protein Barba1A_gp007 [Rheinheimera phage vB_RspM_Barba1A]QCQ57994.1 hypothetical protein Barba1S_gp007 [Rheinheimera phage vB_RspM_Barba1S]QCQ58130.1 hypothetical protein
MSEFRIGDKVRRVCESNVEVVQGSVYKIRGFDIWGDLKLEGLEDFGYIAESFDLVAESDSQPTYTPSELSYIAELEDRVDYLESLCGDYAAEIEKLRGITINVRDIDLQFKPISEMTIQD